MSGSGRHRVLLVDDSSIDRAVYRSMILQKMPQVAVEEAGTGDEAIQLLRGQRYDCVFLDFEMPGRNGLAVLEAVERYNRSPVVMLTGTDDAETAVDALRAGAMDYLLKDRIDADQVAEALQAAILQQRQRQAREEQYRRLAVLQALLMQSGELLLVVNLSTQRVVEAGTVGLARLGFRRADVVDRDVRELPLFGPGGEAGGSGWEAFTAAYSGAPAPWQPVARDGQRPAMLASAQTLTVDGTAYLLVQARPAAT